MPNLELTLSELEFLQRLIGHHSCGGGFDRFYDKLANLAELHRVYSDKPLPLRKPYPTLYGERLTFALATQDWRDDSETL